MKTFSINGLTGGLTGGLALLALIGLVWLNPMPQVNAQPAAPSGDAGTAENAETTSKNVSRAIFAGGCFWCMEPPYDALEGVISTVAGYTGGQVENPSYEQVSAGASGHVEAIEISYDPARIDYQTLLEVFWRNVDPTRDDGQFCDQGAHYRPVIFYQDARQRRLIDESLRQLEASKPFPEAIKVDVLAAAPFYPAEDYHQDYYLKNPIRYTFYRYSCGRDKRLRQLWGERPGRD